MYCALSERTRSEKILIASCVAALIVANIATYFATNKIDNDTGVLGRIGIHFLASALSLCIPLTGAKIAEVFFGYEIGQEREAQTTLLPK